MKKSVLLFTALLFALVSCKTDLKPTDLYGTWKYVKVENPNANPPDSVSRYELQAQSPYIKFSANDSLVIIWGGKVLSHGKFKLDGSDISYTETMADGKTRTFPFYVSKITGKDLIFETRGEDGTKVTAVKE